ncbi:MAG: purine biosynthesis protein PurH [Eubacterium sp.]|nr:purine biosynthesis protein PurH [Eubacterium sp.]
MPGYLIKDTTTEERRKIVEEALGNIEASCDGCMPGLAEMYEAYIRGEKEIRDINMEFSARYVKGDMEREERAGCLYRG